MSAAIVREGDSVEAARRALTAHFARAGLDTPELDARLLIGVALDLDLTSLVVSAARTLADDEATLLNGFAQRRIGGEPVARILGVKEFWSLPLELSVDTLVPRPDTETLVEATLDILRDRRLTETSLRIADLGTGSGAIILALLSELPQATGYATDISIGALRTASNNAHLLRLAHRVHFIECNYASALLGPFDIIVSNPPYIRSAEIESLAPDVRNFEPRRALDGGADGLYAYRVIAAESSRLLAPEGALLLEVGYDQASAVSDLLVEAGLALSHPPVKDLNGIARVVIGQKRG
jgi:release factor glutamine methyltransferase